MKITKISEQIKNPNRVSIFLDGKYSFSLNLDQLLDEKLKISQDIDEQALNDLKKKSDLGKMRLRTIEWLYIRPRSAKELTTYLRSKKLDPDEINSLISNLQLKGYQNDEQFTQWWFSQRQAKHKSNRYIVNELRAKGISSEVLNKYYEEHVIDDKTAIQELITKKRLLQKYSDKQKLYSYLLRQGFSYDLIKEVVNQ